MTRFSLFLAALTAVALGACGGGGEKADAAPQIDAYFASGSATVSGRG